jgi:hypothetical protein
MKRHALAVAAATVALLLATSSPATAAPNWWPDTAACATGAFTDHEIVVDEFLAPSVKVSGWAAPCPAHRTDAGAQGDARFGFAYFPYPGSQDPGSGLLDPERLRRFTSATEPTRFTGRFDRLTAGSGGSTDMPMCLMRSLDSRVACILVRMAEDAEPTVTQISVDDPRVSSPVRYYLFGEAGRPNCGWCL